MADRVCDAILKRSVIEFNYDGGVRIVEPHCHGFSSAGKEVVLAYQIDGYSKSGDSSGWRLYEVAKITDLSFADAIFPIDRPGFDPQRSNLSYIHCCV